MYQNATSFWDEQRNFTDLALEALGNHSLADTIREEFAKIEPRLQFGHGGCFIT